MYSATNIQYMEVKREQRKERKLPWGICDILLDRSYMYTVKLLKLSISHIFKNYHHNYYIVLDFPSNI